MTLRITRGDNETITIYVTDPDAGDTLRLTDPSADDPPVDLTGDALWFMVKNHYGDADADAILTKTTASGITLRNQVIETGWADVELDASDTDTLRPAVYNWEVQLVSAGGEVKTLAHGYIDILADLVREVV